MMGSFLQKDFGFGKGRDLCGKKSGLDKKEDSHSGGRGIPP